MNDEYYMNLAIEQAKKAFKADEVPVGAIIVDKENNIIGHGYNCPISSNDTTSHAEINAIRMACKKLHNYRLIDTILYVTIEPCIMCFGAIIHARIKRVVFGTKNLKQSLVISLFELFDNKGLNYYPQIVSGICASETKKIIKDFFFR